jgi:putative oxidoreductase
MHKLTQMITKMLSSFQDLSLLMVRLMLAYGFFKPALKKINNFDNIVVWFDTGLHLPFPWLMALLATVTEALIVVFMVLGFKSRLIAVPGMITMLVAIFLVHWNLGFSASNNGYEIALYYFLFLSIIATIGPGKYSLDETVLAKWFGSKK